MIRHETGWDDATPGLLARIGYDAARAFVHFACRLWFRIEVVGSEHIPSKGAFIMSPVHRSYIDTVLIMAITRRRLRFLGAAWLWNHRPLAWILSTLGGIPLEQGTALRAKLRIAGRALAAGEPLAIFPEGARGAGPVVDKLFDGPTYLASRHGVPIIPVGIGAARAMRSADRFILPTKVVVVIGEPIWPDGDGVAPRRIVRQLSEVLRADLQARFDEAQRRAGQTEADARS